MIDPELWNILKGTSIYTDVIDAIETVYVLLKDFEEFKPENLIECTNEYIKELKEEEFMENYRLRQTWDYFFTDNELLKYMLIYYINIDPHKWVNLFDKYTDYSTSEINEFIQYHVDCFELDIDDWKFYSSGLDI